MDKKLIAIGAALAGVVVFWATQNRNDATRGLAERGDEPDPKNAAESMRVLESALEESRQLLQSGRLIESARKLYHIYPGFESYLHSQGYQEIQPGLTLNAWFEARKTAFAKAIADEYPKLVETLKSGDLTWREVNTFFSEMPFPFIHELRRAYEQEKKEIARARAVLATNWCFVSVIAVSGSGETYERIVREALQKRWDAQSGLKLIFDNPSSGEESRAAAKLIDIRIEEKFAEYAFEGDPARGGGKVAERATVRFSSRNSTSPLKTNWEALPPMTVTNEAPEVLRFKFENTRQTADFSNIASRQREALEQKLSAALESLPRFERLTVRLNQ